MPIANVTFYTSGAQPSFAAETRTGDYVYAFPLLANEPTALEVVADYTQLRANYAAPALNAPLTVPSPQNIAANVTAYFTHDDDFEDLGGGVCRWKRHWFTLPASWSEPGGTFAYAFPAFTGSTSYGNVINVTGVIANGNYYSANGNITGISAGDQVYFDLNYVRSNQNLHATFYAPARYVNSGVNVGISLVLPGTGAFSGVTGQLFKGGFTRSAVETLEVDSFLVHDYALADESTVDTLLPPIDKFSPVTYGFGSVGAEVSILTSSTKPTAAQYVSMVDAGTLIVARRSDRRKYAGNIYERTTLLVKAR